MTGILDLTASEEEYVRSHHDRGVAPHRSRTATGTTLLRRGLLTVEDNRVVVGPLGRLALAEAAFEHTAAVINDLTGRCPECDGDDLSFRVDDRGRIDRVECVACRWSINRPTLTMTRAQAEALLAAREGAPPELLEHARDEDLLAAALAPAGQPCADCGKLVVWTEGTEDEHGADWRHADTPSACFLARNDER